MKMTQFSFRNGTWSAGIPRDWDSANTLIIVYFASKMAQSPLWKELKEAMPSSILMGCSGAGEIRRSELVDDEAVVTVVKFESTRLSGASLSLSKDQDSESAGRELARKFPAAGLKALYILSDGLHVNGTALINGIRGTVGKHAVISGGLAGDGTDFKKTFVLVDGTPTENAVSAVAFYGENIQVTASSCGGWKPFGPLRKITKSRANVLYELDNKPALELYKQFLGDQAKKLPSAALLFPLHLGSGPEKNGSRDIVRTILSVNEKEQSMTFAGDVPEGTSVQLMRTGYEGLVDAAQDAAKRNMAKCTDSSAILSLIVSCVGRRLVLGEDTEAEIDTVLEQLPGGTFQTGFYSYGEIAPGRTGVCDLHNQTMTVTLIQEKKAA